MAWEARAKPPPFFCEADDAFATGTITESAVLTAEVESAPAFHSGQPTSSSRHTFEVRIAFSEALHDGFKYRTLRDHAFEVTGGRVVNAGRLVSGENRRWAIKVRPSGDDPVTLTAAASPACDAAGAVCTGDGRRFTAGLTVEVPGPGENLQAAFENVQAAHDGRSSFTVRLRFSHPVTTTSAAMWQVGQLTGGLPACVQRVDGRSDLWDLTIHPQC